MDANSRSGADEITVDLLVVGSGTGLAAALSAHEQGLDVLVVEKTRYVGGSTARSGGAFWIPANPALKADGSTDTHERGAAYLDAVVGDSAPVERRREFLANGDATVEMLGRTTPLKFAWARGYSDYHAELPGGDAEGRSVESRPFDLSVLGRERRRFRPGVVEAPVPMPVTGADYKWMNLMAKMPVKAMPKIIRRVLQGVGGRLIGRRYVAGGQALAAGLFAGAIRADIPIWTNTSLVELTVDGDRVTGAVVQKGRRRVHVTARRGVVLAAGGFDHDMDMRHRYQSERLGHWSLGSEGNTGDAIKLAADVGADLTLMRESWWFPAVAPLPGESPQVLLAERSLPGSLMVDMTGRRFINESTDYMTFGQRLLALEKAGTPVEKMWLVFDQEYRNSYVLAGGVFPRMPLPREWYENGIAHRGDAREIATAIGMPVEAFTATIETFNAMARTGVDDEFGRGSGAYDRYYGDPTVRPNPNLRPLEGGLYAVQVVLSDLGTTGGLRADGDGRVLRADGSAIGGLYAIGNTAANAFGNRYPGAGATISQGLVYGHIVARHAASRATTDA